jgi:small-conductance mechanosensitive channel
LWTAYQRKRDHDKDFGFLEEEMWDAFISLEKEHKRQDEQEQAVEKQAAQELNDKIVDVTVGKRLDKLEEDVAYIVETLRTLKGEDRTLKELLERV